MARGIDYVPAALGLPDSSYTASSIYHTNWYPYDTFPWFQTDLLNVYTMIDLYLRKEFDFYVILFHLKASIDGSTHYYIEQNIVPDYLANEVYSTYWFDNATDDRYWIIEQVHGQYELYPFIGGDLIGYLCELLWRKMNNYFT